MSILQQVIDEYGISENPEAPTDKTDKRVRTPEPPTDKTDKRASVSSVSDRSEGFEINHDEFEAHELAVAKEILEIMQMREKGICPDHYTATTECIHCGPVPIFEGVPEKVEGCPWCFNRLKGLAVPEAIPAGSQ